VLSLHELQHAFVEAVLGADDPSDVDSCILDAGISARRRLQIYRNNAREGFISAMSATYPVVERLAGREWFRQTALRYREMHPSHSGDLQYAGQCFAAFLREELSNTPHVYFADVARLEWAYQEVLIAPETPRLDLTRLQSIPEQAHGQLCFRIVDDARWISSSFPILDIWKANREPLAGETDISLDAGPSRVVIVRRADHVELRELSANDFILLVALSERLSLEEAAAKVALSSPEFDLGVSLVALAQLDLFSDFFFISDGREL
jgi:hypothetical protein